MLKKLLSRKSKDFSRCGLNILKRINEISNTPSVVALGRFASMGFSLLTLPIIARVIGPEGRGVTATVISILLITSILVGLGVPLVIRRKVSEGGVLKDILRTSRVFALLTVFPSLLCAFLSHILLLQSVSPSELMAFYLSMVLVPASVSWAQDVNVLISLQKYRRMAILGLLQSAVYFSVVLMMAIYGFLSTTAVIYAYLSGSLITCFIGLSWLSDRGGKIVDLSGLIKEGLSLIGGQLADVGARKFDQLITLPLLGANNAGLYSVATTISGLSVPLVQALSVATYAKVVGVGKDKTKENSSLIKQSILLSGLAAFFLGVFAPIAIPLVFGDDFSDALYPTIIALVGSVFLALNYTSSIALSAQGKGRAMTISQVTGMICMLVLIFPLGYFFNIEGVAVASVVGALVTAVMCVKSMNISALACIPTLGDMKTLINSLFGSK
ncbi:lipopolysaccharide biosynthesis protein [Brenneria tiliae]|uniref:Oligosaccharide flippase family protein n=1 Tax=Brenneria tiliae TaxID=2914984 RepID=A0ABT0MY08_9GAMM|nr:oligosaccharide flippase family protein [Brenneria tiliae]MCL2894642.1 oligosaccharide flippase family protein [Brenneria tiliae]